MAERRGKKVERKERESHKKGNREVKGRGWEGKGKGKSYPYVIFSTKTTFFHPSFCQ